MERNLMYFGLVDDGGKAISCLEWAALAQGRAGWRLAESRLECAFRNWETADRSRGTGNTIIPCTHFYTTGGIVVIFPPFYLNVSTKKLLRRALESFRQERKVVSSLIFDNCLHKPLTH
jgi:hypothetical protein